LPDDPAQITHLWPDEASLSQSFLSDNDKSEVLRIDYAGRTILICSDIEQVAQSALISKFPDLTADVLILPHHGSKTSPPDQLVKLVGASTVIASCSSSRAPAAWKSDDPNCMTWYTGIHGAITITIKADGTLGTTGFAQSIDLQTPDGV
jgi:beta-lactamase superfamily II metal-dependent hydrolase